jgi:hypothetical protein
MTIAGTSNANFWGKFCQWSEFIIMAQQFTPFSSMTIARTSNANFWGKFCQWSEFIIMAQFTVEL